MKRLFIAVDISEEARNVAAKYISALREEFSELRVGWERPEKLHITLAFLGRTEDSQIAEIGEILTRIAKRHVPFQLAMSGRGVFPSARKPRVLWLGVEDRESKLTELAEDVIDEITRLGFEPEKRKFSPHLTIARIKEPQAARNLAEKHLQMKYEPVQFEVGHITLYESQLRPTGSIYSKLKLFKLQ
jgi:2'-5' RNA ligase